MIDLVRDYPNVTNAIIFIALMTSLGCVAAMFFLWNRTADQLRKH